MRQRKCQRICALPLSVPETRRAIETQKKPHPDDARWVLRLAPHTRAAAGNADLPNLRGGHACAGELRDTT
jgi:hypothetical protein